MLTHKLRQSNTAGASEKAYSRWLPILILVCALGNSGCAVIAAGAESLYAWDLPASVPKPGHATGIEMSLTLLAPTIAWMKIDMGNDDLQAWFITYDVFGWDSMEGKPWFILKPLLGKWYWDDAPGKEGLMMGLRTGLGIPLHPEGAMCLTFEVGVNAFGNMDTSEPSTCGMARIALVVNPFAGVF